MPNIKSAKKRVLVTQKKAARNKAAKSALKTVMKKSSAEPSVENIRLAIKKVDQAAARGILHKNTASRRKSSLMKKLQASA